MPSGSYHSRGCTLDRHRLQNWTLATTGANVWTRRNASPRRRMKALPAMPRQGATAVNPRSRVRRSQPGSFVTMRYPLVFPESLSVVFIAFHKSVAFTHDGGYL